MSADKNTMPDNYGYNKKETHHQFGWGQIHYEIINLIKEESFYK
jgi:hypothetical protein